MITPTHCTMHGRRVFIFSVPSAQKNLVRKAYSPASCSESLQLGEREDQVFNDKNIDPAQKGRPPSIFSYDTPLLHP